MMNKDFAIIPSLIVFAAILGFYRLLTYFASHNEKFEDVLEGKPVYIIEDGMFSLDSNEHTIAKDEFFAEMRVKNIEQLGQVRTAILETNGQVSFFYYEPEDTKAGLPILPRVYNQKSRHVETPGSYACTKCGSVMELEKEQRCKRCDGDEWVGSSDLKRIT